MSNTRPSHPVRARPKTCFKPTGIGTRPGQRWSLAFLSAGPQGSHSRDRCDNAAPSIASGLTTDMTFQGFPLVHRLGGAKLAAARSCFIDGHARRGVWWLSAVDRGCIMPSALLVIRDSRGNACQLQVQCLTGGYDCRTC